MPSKKDLLEITKVSEPPDSSESSVLLSDAIDAEIPETGATATRLQQAQAMKITVDQNLRQLTLEHDKEQIELKIQARGQQFALLTRQASNKADELAHLKEEHEILDKAAADKRKVLEVLKSDIEAERHRFTSAKNAAADLQTELKRLADSQVDQNQILLDQDRSFRKLQQRQTSLAEEMQATTQNLEQLQILLVNEHEKLKALQARQKMSKELHEVLIEKNAAIDRSINDKQAQLAKIIDDCQDQARSILALATHEAQQLKEEGQKSLDLMTQERLQQVHASANEKLAEASTKAERMINETQVEIAQGLAGAKARAKALTDDAAAQGAHALAKSQALSEQIKQQAKAEASALMQQTTEESDRITLEMRKQVESIEAASYAEKKRILEEAEQTRKQILNAAHEIRLTQIEQANKYANDLMTEAEGNKAKLQEEISGLADYLERERKSFYQSLDADRIKVQQEILLERQRHEKYAEQERLAIDAAQQERNEAFRQEKASFYAILEAEKTKSEEQAKILMREAERQMQGLEQSIADRTLEFEGQVKSRQVLYEKEWGDKAQLARAKVEQELSELRNLTERDMVQLQARQEAGLQNWIKSQQEGFRLAQTRHRSQIVETIAAMVHMSLRSHFPPAEHASLIQIPALVRKSAEEAFFEAEKQTQAVSQHMPQSIGAPAKFKDLRYWRSLLLQSSLKWGLLAAGLVLVMVLWKNYNDNQSLSAANSYVAEQVKKRKRTPYITEQTNFFKANYTDNVLFTTNYLNLERDNEFRNRWIVALNRHASTGLEMSNEVIVKLLSKEATMLKQLEKLKSEIDGKLPAPDIAKLRGLEEKYRQQMVAIVGSEDKFKAFYGFKTNYFAKALQLPAD